MIDIQANGQKNLHKTLKKLPKRNNPFVYTPNKRIHTLQVVFVDNEQDHLNNFQNKFGSSFKSLKLFKSPKEAIQYLTMHDNVDIVISDFKMPDLTGIELFERIKNHSCLKILYTGYVLLGHEINLLPTLNVHKITKVSNVNLISEISVVLNRIDSFNNTNLKSITIIPNVNYNKFIKPPELTQADHSYIFETYKLLAHKLILDLKNMPNDLEIHLSSTKIMTVKELLFEIGIPTQFGINYLKEWIELRMEFTEILKDQEEE